MIGLCESAEQSEAIRANLVQEFGFADNIIVNHPNNDLPEVCVYFCKTVSLSREVIANVCENILKFTSVLT